MLSNPGKCVTAYELCEIFTPAYQHVASHEKAVKGFESAGVVPYNPDVFSEDDFAPATVTELTTDDVPAGPTQPVSMPAPDDAGLEHNTDPCTTAVDGTSGSLGHAVHVLDISPYPRASNDGRSIQRCRAEASIVLTSTPNKKMLEAKAADGNKSAARKKLNLSPPSKKKAVNRIPE